MTLLEAVVSFVLLSLVGIVCLDQGRGAAQLQRSSEEWTQAVAIGETALALATETGPGDVAINGVGQGNVMTARRPWRGGLDLVTVSVPLSGGISYQIAKLVPNGSAVRSARAVIGETR